MGSGSKEEMRLIMPPFVMVVSARGLALAWAPKDQAAPFAVDNTRAHHTYETPGEKHGSCEDTHSSKLRLLDMSELSALS